MLRNSSSTTPPTKGEMTSFAHPLNRGILVYSILSIVSIGLTILGALAIILYTTWLLIHRLRKGEKASKSFLTWLKHIFEAVMGL